MKTGPFAPLRLGQIISNDIVQGDVMFVWLIMGQQREFIQAIAQLFGIKIIQTAGIAPQFLQHRQGDVCLTGENCQFAIALTLGLF